jgi:hypothetical protein
MNPRLLLTVVAAALALAHPLALPLQAAQKKGSAKLLIDAWYTITLNNSGVAGPIRYGYYNDHLEQRDGKLFFQNQVWKLEQGFINEEQLGAMAEDNADLTPLLYNFHSKYRTTETLIDGTVKDGKVLTIKVRHGSEEMPQFRRALPSKTIFEVFFPVWLGRHTASLEPGKSVAFSTFLEDSVDKQFETMTGRVKAEKPDDFARSSKTTKVSVDFGGATTRWWIDSSGVTKKIENPSLGQVIEKVDRKTAESFLTSAPAQNPPDSE